MANIQKALEIGGWMTPEELSWLAEQASRRSSIVEIGSWKGRSTRALAENTAGIVHAVDTWKGDSGTEGAEPLKDKPAGWLFEQFQKSMEGLSNVRTYPMSSLEAALLLRDMRFDMIFIDASHGYEDVKADILAWRPLLSEGGLLCGHDFSFPPVAQAVNELVLNPKSAAGILWYA